MKIAVCDFRFHKGHKTFNGAVLHAVAKISENDFVFFDNGNNYRDSEEFSDNRVVIKNRNNDANTPLRNRLNSRKYMIDEYAVVKKQGCDKIICLAFDLLTFGIFGRKYFDKDIYLWHHAESDELTNGLKQKVFKKYMNRVNHIVHAPFIRDYLIDFGVDKSRVFVCPFIKTSKTAAQDRTLARFFVAPSGSNDENFCKELVEYEKRTGFFVNNEITLYIKSFTTAFDNGFLKLYNDYLSLDEYNSLYEKAAAVVMPFPSSFRMRESGTIIDALSSGKKVIAPDIPIARYYGERCKDIDSNAVSIYTTVEDFCGKLLQDAKIDGGVSQSISAEHDDQAMLNALRNAVNGI